MARPRRPLSPAAQAERARRQAAKAASQGAYGYWKQQANPAGGGGGATPGGAGYAADEPWQAPADLFTGGIRVGGLPPTVPTQFDQWLQGYQPYINAVNQANVDRTTQIAQGAKGIGEALGMWGGDISEFTKSLSGALLDPALTNGQQFFNAIDWGLVNKTADDANKGGVSIMAQLEKAQRDRQFGLESDANARGIFRSGETMDSTQRNEVQRGQEQYAQQKQLMDFLTGISSAFAQAENQRAAGINTAATDAQGYYLDPNNQVPGVAGMAGAAGAGDPTAPPPASTAPAAAPAAQSQAAKREAARRKRAAAQSAAARARAQAQRRAG